jgi:hypothetical protein
MHATAIVVTKSDRLMSPDPERRDENRPGADALGSYLV